MEIDPKTFKNLRLLRVLFKNVSASDLGEIVEKLTLLHEEKKAAEEQRSRALEAKRAKIQQILEDMRAGDISLEELSRLSSATPENPREKSRRTMPPRYRYTALDGHSYTWTGQGKLPVRLRQLMEKEGFPKEHYLIEKKSVPRTSPAPDSSPAKNTGTADRENSGGAL